MIDSIFHPERHKELNAYIEAKSQEWIAEMIKLNKR